jgi:lipase
MRGVHLTGCHNLLMPSLCSPAVFVHGLIGSFYEPAAVEALLGRPSSAPDLIGYGPTTPESISVESQVASLRDHIRDKHGHEPVHLIAHSIGAVYAFEYAARYPKAVATIINVEGNFSLADAFWSSSIAAMPANVAQASIEELLADAEGWLQASGIEVTGVVLERARRALNYQAWTTVWASAKAIVARSGEPKYQDTLRSVFTKIPVHLVAGENSESGWAVPEWALRSAASYDVIPGVGHMMMLEQPELFGAQIGRLLHTYSPAA